jgi:hypothetical protein
LGVAVCLGKALGPFLPGFVGGTFLSGPEQSGAASCVSVAVQQGSVNMPVALTLL